MKMLVAYVQPFMENHVMDVLHRMEEVSGVTFQPVRGFGRGRLKEDAEGGLGTTHAKIRMEVVVADEAAERVRLAIQAAAHTGRAGDGKIFVLPVEHAVRISTGEEGGKAI